MIAINNCFNDNQQSINLDSKYNGVKWTEGYLAKIWR